MQIICMLKHAIRAESGRAPAPSDPSLRLGRVRLAVSDLGRSIAFYRDLLGLTLVHHAGPIATLGAGSQPLLELEEGPDIRPPARGTRLGLYHVALLLPERRALGALLRHLAGQGVHPGASDHLVSEALYLRDPDGLGLEVYVDRPAAQWGRAPSGELAMATAPLDVEELLAEAAGTPWEGMPSGSRIGHLHLHVGSLKDAARFYADGVGLQPTVTTYPGALFLAAEGYHHHLGLNTWAGPAAVPAAEHEARLLHWEIVLPTAEALRAMRARLERLGERCIPDGDAVTVRDPWGTTLRLRAALP